MKFALNVGDKFSAPTHLPGHTVEVLELVPERNRLRVRICPPEESRTTWEEDWNLEHTYAGFKNRTYRMGDPAAQTVAAGPNLRRIADLPNFQVVGATTGRFSSTDPPKSNYPKPSIDVFDDRNQPLDFAAIESRTAEMFAREVGDRDLQTAEMLTLFDKVLALLPIPTGERLAEHPEWMQQLIPLTAQYVDLAAKLRKRLCDNEQLKSAAAAAVAAEWFAKSETPPGYQNYYHAGIWAHNRGVHPDQAPFHQLDQKVTLAWLRGWTAAYRANSKPTPHDEVQS